MEESKKDEFQGSFWDFGCHPGNLQTHNFWGVTTSSYQMVLCCVSSLRLAFLPAQLSQTQLAPPCRICEWSEAAGRATGARGASTNHSKKSEGMVLTCISMYSHPPHPHHHQDWMNQTPHLIYQPSRLASRVSLMMLSSGCRRWPHPAQQISASGDLPEAPEMSWQKRKKAHHLAICKALSFLVGFWKGLKHSYWRGKHKKEASASDYYQEKLEENPLSCDQQNFQHHPTRKSRNFARSILKSNYKIQWVVNHIKPPFHVFHPCQCQMQIA